MVFFVIFFASLRVTYNDEHNLEITIGNLSMLMKEWDAAEAIERLEKEEQTKKELRKILEKVKKKE